LAVKTRYEKAYYQEKLTKLMDTSRTQIYRILDPKAENLTLETLQRAARVAGKVGLALNKSRGSSQEFFVSFPRIQQFGQLENLRATQQPVE
jgi:transcriptional regulator with XRE-family HTH domain